MVPAGLSKSSVGVVILGMHRSGTSALAGILGKCGAWIGSDQDLTEANSENPKGFFERRDIRAICDGLLHAAGADWWRILEFSIEAIPPDALAEQGRAFEHVVRDLEGHGTWLIKEPRLCLLLPVLRFAIPNAVCVHVYRNPFEVACSLQARNGFCIAEGLALWEIYNRAAITASLGHPRIFVAYDELVRNPAEAIAKLVNALKYEGDSSLEVPDQKTIEHFISEELHRHRSDIADADLFLSQSQRDLWQRLRSEKFLREEGSASISHAARQHLRGLEVRMIGTERLRNQLKAANERVKTLEAQLRSQNAKTEHEKPKLSSALSVFFSARIAAPVRALSSRVNFTRREASHNTRPKKPR